MKRKRIACVGIIVADVSGKPIDRFPGRGELTLFDELGMSTGGCAANTAAGLARMGFDAMVVGKVGDDSFGKFTCEDLGAAGADTSGIKADKRVSTSFTFVTVASDGERSFFHTQGANATFGLKDIDMDVIKKADAVVVGGAMLMKRFDGAETARFLKRVRNMGKITMLDMAFNDRVKDWMSVVAPSMPYLDYFLPSYEEAARASGKTDCGDIATVFRNLGARVVGIKLGDKGSYVRSETEEITAPVYKVKAVNTLGAGDAWVAGFVAGVMQELTLAESALLGNATAAHCVMAMGAADGIRKLAVIKRFQKAQGLKAKVKRLS